MSKNIKEWSKAANYAMELGEGNPELWGNLGLIEICKEWQERLNLLNEISVAIYNPTENIVKRVLGGVCIHRSNGEFDNLPLSFLWETLVIAMFAKVLNVEGVILLPIAEEINMHPNLELKYKKMAIQVEEMVCKLSKLLKVKLSTYWNASCYKLDVDPISLYGLFQPYSDSLQLKSYPLGEIEEKRILSTYESYCARYKYPPNGINNNDLIVDGIHLAKSVILGLNKSAMYVATLPIDSLDGEKKLLVDCTNHPNISQKVILPSDWWCNEILYKVFGVSFNNILEASNLQSSISVSCSA